MDIRCERCATEYEIEDERIPAAGLTIKCATCAHVFKVLKTASTLPPAAPPPPAVTAPPVAPVQPPPFALRLFRGGTAIPATCPDMGTLHQWIIEQRIVATDEASFGGEPWRALSAIPELAPFFALLSVPPPPKTRPTIPLEPLASPPPLPPAPVAVVAGMVPAPVISMPNLPAFHSALTAPTPPPSYAPPSMPSPRAHTDDELTPASFGTPYMPTPLGTPMWNSPITTLPPINKSAVTSGSSFPTPVDSPKAHEENGSTAATQQFQVTPEMFAAARAASTPTSAAPSWPPVATPSSMRPMMAPPAPTVAANAPVQADVKTPIRPMSALNLPPAKKPVAKGPMVSDPEIKAFVQRGKFVRVVLIAAGVLLASAVGVYFAFPSLFGSNAPAADAKTSFDKGRTLYLTDTLAQFPEAEKLFVKAAGKEKGEYPEAEGGLAELNTAWAELLLERYSVMSAELNTKTEAGKTDEAKALRPKVNKLADEAKKRLASALDEFSTLKEAQSITTEGNRAALDYYRLANDPQQAATAADSLKDQTDPETMAHLAAWQAMDPKSAPQAETTLKDVIQKQPNFVRARFWLAQLHARSGNLPAALTDMQEILKVAPQQEAAKDFVTAAAKPTTPPAAPAEPPPAKEEPKEAKETQKKESSALPRLAPEEVAKRNGGDASPASSGAPVDVDKAIDQAGRFLEKGKASKALELYDRVLAVKPTLSDALYGKGVALYEMGHTEEAIVAFKKTLDVNHRFGDAMIGVAEAYKKTRDNKSAVKFYQQYLDMYPTGAQAASARANVQALK